jgi:hypothetical protein
MKNIKTITAGILTLVWLATPFVGLAQDKKTEKAKPYPLDKCVVSDEKLGEHGKPYAFVHEGQEIKMCCKDCLKDFKKDTAKYMKKIEEADKNAKK